MHQEQKRIFVGNLPPNVQQNEIQKQFSEYGNVVSVEIKHRKAGTAQDISPVFAFVNIQIDERTLNKCFQEFSDYDWNGYNVKLDLAKESFLERLKREREESNNKPTEIPVAPTVKQEYVPKVNKAIYTKTVDTSDSSSESSSSESEEEIKVVPKQVIKEIKEELDYVIKHNKFKNLNGKTLKIESFNAPIHVITKIEKKEIKNPKALEAEEKRKKSLLLMKNSYQQQKLAIKSALSNVDNKRNNKILFDEGATDKKKSTKRKNTNETNSHEINNKKNKLSLFNEDVEDEDNINFGIKQQFEGQQGHKLLELQSRFTNDKRFTLDSRFLDEGEAEIKDELSEEDEKQQQYDILETVLGHKVRNRKPIETTNKNNKPHNSMLRFDPSKPEHSKFEIKESDEQKERKKKPKMQKEEKPEEINPVQVSKETFYKVTDNLKQSLQENQTFSLLSMFGRTEEKDGPTQDEMKDIPKTKQISSRNPFRYDSSDSEDDDTKTGKAQKNIEDQEIKKPDEPTTRPIQGRETFFFHNDDERLKEGLDFLKKLSSEEQTQPFDEKRRELKLIVRAKMRNNLRNNRPFRQKLGRHKMIKVKKAKKK